MAPDPLQAVLLGFVVWIVVPAIMLTILCTSMVIAARVQAPLLRISARSGLLAGSLFFVIYVAAKLASLQAPQFTFNYVPHLNFLALAAGLVGGFAFLSVIRILLPTRMVGVLTLVLTFCSASALFEYIFVSTTRDIALFVTLGAVGGVLLHLIVAPESIRSVLSASTS
jgi:hypothetical protein